MVRRRTPSVIVAALCLIGALSARSAAQSAVTGTVVDSLSSRPLPSATIQLVSLLDPAARPMESLTDSMGRFRFAAVPTGRYLIGFLHRRFDDLGLQPQTYSLEVKSSDTLIVTELTSPSGEALASAFCGARRDSSGLLLGRVLSPDDTAPKSGATVVVNWRELVVTKARGVGVHELSVRGTADESGRYAVCGVPTGNEVVVQAVLDSARTGRIEVRVPPHGTVLRDFILAERPAVAARSDTAVSAAARAAPVRHRTARITGHVRRTDGEVPASTQLSLWGPDSVEASTRVDASGAFTLEHLPAGTFTLEVRALGYNPKHLSVDLVNGVTTPVEVTMDERIALLDTLRVSARGKEKDISGFDERAAKSWYGHIMTQDKIERMHMSTAGMLLSTVPGLLVVPTGTGSRIFSRGYLNLTNRCEPTVYLDGTPLNGATLEDFVEPRDLRGIEVYLQAGTAPIPYDKNPCGAVLVWTKHTARGEG
jgi:hypothetical protein